jgi:hypothetical protein
MHRLYLPNGVEEIELRLVGTRVLTLHPQRLQVLDLPTVDHLPKIQGFQLPVAKGEVLEVILGYGGVFLGVLGVLTTVIEEFAALLEEETHGLRIGRKYVHHGRRVVLGEVDGR